MGLVFLDTTPLSGGDPELFLSPHVAAAGTWSPFFRSSPVPALASTHSLISSSHIVPELLGCCARGDCGHCLAACHSGKNTGCGVRSPTLTPVISAYYLGDGSPDTVQTVPKIDIQRGHPYLSKMLVSGIIIASHVFS